MEGGRLLQVGSPREVYDRPLTRFVATFVGESSFLPATASGGVARLATGEAVAETGGEGPVTLAVRPEAVRVGPAGQGVAATVRGLTFTGADLLVDLALPDGTPLAARVPAGTALLPGAAVGVTMAARVLAE
jgi:spermidine/putrescine transport system ATP-binding protein